MDRLLRILCVPGARHAAEAAAPTQHVVIEKACQDGGDEKETQVTVVPKIIDNTYTVAPKPWRLDRWLDKVVEWSGSQFVFFMILGALITWAFLGIIFSELTDWQVGISDGQAIINLVFDSFLMRQQLNSYGRTLEVLGVLKSRVFSNKRMLRELVKKERERRVQEGEKQHLARMAPTAFAQSETKELAREGQVYEKPSATICQQQQRAEERVHPEFAAELPTENLFGRICTTISKIMGHIATVSLFWVGIVTWISFGPRDHWSSTWLLYINSATSALMVFILAFLANIRERHGEYSNRCLEAIWKVDAALELNLRVATGDATLNPTVSIPAPCVTKIQRVINYYADLVGALVGIAILILTMIIWLAIGPAMAFSSNWWLLIGTYAGLVGMNDGFVLRNVFHKLRGYEDDLFSEVGWEDEVALSLLDSLQTLPGKQQELMPQLPQQQQASSEAIQTVPGNSLTERISLRVGAICSHEYAVLLGVVTIIGLIIGASAMGWSLTGQLLCNVPPSIIETFFMMILITGHNLGDRRRRSDLARVHARRLRLLKGVEGVVGAW